MYTYTAIGSALTLLDARRNRIADQIGNQLLGAAFHGQPVDVWRSSELIAQADALLFAARALGHSVNPVDWRPGPRKEMS